MNARSYAISPTTIRIPGYVSTPLSTVPMTETRQVFLMKLAYEACIRVAKKNPYHSNQPGKLQLLYWKQADDIEVEFQEKSALIACTSTLEMVPAAVRDANVLDDDVGAWLKTQIENFKHLSYWILEDVFCQCVVAEDTVEEDVTVQSDGEDVEDGWSGMY
jgi:hypothetical protein